jgi:TonB family protein
MMRAVLTLAGALALQTSVQAQEKLSPPPLVIAPMPPPYRPQRSWPELLVAIDAWKTGDPAKAATAYASVERDAVGKFGGPVERQFLSDWVLALTYSNPVAAQAKLDEWNGADPIRDPLDDEAMKRLVHQTRITLRQSGAEAAGIKVAKARTDLDAARAKLDEYLKTARKAGNKKAQFDYATSARLGDAEKHLRAAELLIAVAQKGESAFADFSGSKNPFRKIGSTSLFVNGRNTVSCASAGLKPEDWMIAELGFDGTTRQVLVVPFAQSRDAVLEHFLAEIPTWGQSYQGQLTLMARQHLFVRCTKSAPPPTDTRPDIDYLTGYLGPKVPTTTAEYEFNSFRDPVSNLVRDGQWRILINSAAQGSSLNPGLQYRALVALQGALLAEATPNPVALAIVRHWLTPTPEPGRPSSARSLIVRNQESVAAAKAVPGLPPRVLARMEFKLGELHEMAGDPVSARPIYAAIVARAPAVLPEGSPEVIRSNLRLAALADAEGKKAEADAIIAKMGLSPEQCSIYQAKPAITKMPEPQYPGFALREEMQGSVQFEFDLSDAGAPTNFRVITSSPPFVFDAATVSSFAKASFAPATRGGDALACEAATQAFVWRMPD